MRYYYAEAAVIEALLKGSISDIRDEDLSREEANRGLSNVQKKE